MKGFKLEQNSPIINSLLDTDKYKLTMGQVNWHRYPKASARYRFKIRNQGIDLRPLLTTLQEELRAVADLRFSESELRFLSKEPHLSDDYIDYLSGFALDFNDLQICAGKNQIDIQASGSMLQASPWETYILSIVNELYFRSIAPEPDYDEGRKRLRAKIDQIKAQGDLTNFNFSDFGTRRRFSKAWQTEVVRTLKQELPNYFSGTSNYQLAHDLKLNSIGTMAHEYLQAWQAFVPPLEAQKAALNAWLEEFNGDMGVALTDVIGMEAFCADLDSDLANAFSGFRHDSGNPVQWGERLIERLTELEVPSEQKVAIWSDGLTVDEMLRLYHTFDGRLKTSFGWGTDLTNDLGCQAINIVMKIVDCNSKPVAKLSDSPGKTMCEDQDYVKWLAASYGRLDEFAA